MLSLKFPIAWAMLAIVDYMQTFCSTCPFGPFCMLKFPQTEQKQNKPNDQMNSVPERHCNDCNSVTNQKVSLVLRLPGTASWQLHTNRQSQKHNENHTNTHLHQVRALSARSAMSPGCSVAAAAAEPMAWKRSLASQKVHLHGLV